MQDGRERRRSLRLHKPGFQLKPAVTILVLTAALLVLLGLSAAGGFGRPLEAMFASQPPSLAHLLEKAAEDFAVVTTVTSLGYVLCVLGVCLVYSQRIFGPAVAFRRHVEALKNGDFSSRVHLRDGDAFTDLERDLNELAEILEANTKPAVEGDPA
jgi:methyl-accepting chemotaxis protein